ncbi:hypothetical protein N9D31_01095 [Oligoflexaceae bacterium]|nr:hypothetical protein [Oligoflexaceae bacterium]
MENDKLPTKPVISSQWAAEAEARQWTHENAEKTMVDGEGLEWRVCQSCEQQVSGERLFEIKIWLEADPSVGQLIESGALDQKTDERLIEILGDAKIPMSTKVKSYTAPTQGSAKNVSQSTIDDMRQRLKKAQINETKRKLLFRFVENKTYFGNGHFPL